MAEPLGSVARCYSKLLYWIFASPEERKATGFSGIWMETDRDISSTAWILGKVETEADWAHHTLFRYIFPITFLVGNFACSCQDFALPQYCFRVFLIFIYKMAAATKSSLYSIW